MRKLTQNRFIGIMALGLLAAIVGMSFGAAMTKTARHATKSDIVFPAKTGGWLVKSVVGTSDLSTSELKAYGREGTRRAVTTAPDASATSIVVVTSGGHFAADDLCVYQYADGTVHESTISSTTTTTIGIADAIPKAGSTDDFVYEVSLMGDIPIGAATGTTEAGEALFATPTDSPLLISLDGTATSRVTATASPQ